MGKLLLHACSAFALEAARLLKERGSGVSPAPTQPPPAPAEDPEDGELPEAPAPGPAPGLASRKRKHSPIVWKDADKQPGMISLYTLVILCKHDRCDRSVCYQHAYP